MADAPLPEDAAMRSPTHAAADDAVTTVPRKARSGMLTCRLVTPGLTADLAVKRQPQDAGGVSALDLNVRLQSGAVLVVRVLTRSQVANGQTTTAAEDSEEAVAAALFDLATAVGAAAGGESEGLRRDARRAPRKEPPTSPEPAPVARKRGGTAANGRNGRVANGASTAPPPTVVPPPQQQPEQQQRRFKLGATHVYIAHYIAHSSRPRVLGVPGAPET